jgi:hypothetical protein
LGCVPFQGARAPGRRSAPMPPNSGPLIYIPPPLPPSPNQLRPLCPVCRRLGEGERPQGTGERRSPIPCFNEPLPTRRLGRRRNGQRAWGRGSGWGAESLPIAESQYPRAWTCAIRIFEAGCEEGDLWRFISQMRLPLEMERTRSLGCVPTLGQDHACGWRPRGSGGLLQSTCKGGISSPHPAAFVPDSPDPPMGIRCRHL